MRGIKKENEYSQELGGLYAEVPKAVFAAIAVSALTIGGDQLSEARRRVVAEWWALYHAGIVAQKPTCPEVSE